jgi:hypothetical protein
MILKSILLLFLLFGCFTHHASATSVDPITELVNMALDDRQTRLQIGLPSGKANI